MPPTSEEAQKVERAAAVISRARALVIAAGAGIGVDSGLPDFRGVQGFWRAYPPYERLGLRFEQLANPAWFQRDPGLAWGFYGHRLELYRQTRPHAGFELLRQWAERAELGGFVFTSNVDGQFQLAGFAEERIVECHGALHWLQCVERCGAGLFSADGLRVDVDEATFRALPPWPACPRCGGLARPNVLMFGDPWWDSRRTLAQDRRLEAWLDAVGEQPRGGLVVVELGAGTAVPSVRMFSEDLVVQHGATLIRINPREPDVPRGQIGLSSGALAGLLAIEQQRRRVGQ